MKKKKKKKGKSFKVPEKLSEILRVFNYRNVEMKQQENRTKKQREN